MQFISVFVLFSILQSLLQITTLLNEEYPVPLIFKINPPPTPAVFVQMIRKKSKIKLIHQLEKNYILSLISLKWTSYM